MEVFARIVGWLGLIVGVIAILFQNVPLAYAAIIVGIVGLFMKESRGMGGTALVFGIIAWLMANIFT